jgi:O-antigen/teichoic acid export membrane protein
VSLTTRLRAVPISAVGAVAAQFSQAGASFLLSLTGLRVLSPDDFGRLALVVGSLIFITAVVTGFIGDSLTILDRADSRIRGALEVWSLVLAAAIFLGATSISWATGFLSVRDSLLFGAALVAFTFEDTARRLLMAQLRFWSVVTVDLAYLVTAGVALGLFYAAQGSLELGDFLIALIVGQTLAVAVAYVLADRDDRWAASMRGAALREVAEFGGWRAAQQSIRPGATLAVRIQIAVIAGTIAVGQLEAARVYVSPALLMVQGLTSFLLATNVRQRDHEEAVARHFVVSVGGDGNRLADFARRKIQRLGCGEGQAEVGCDRSHIVGCGRR